MAAPASADEFVDLVRKSGVVEEKRLDGYVHQLRTRGAMPADPSRFAGLMVRDGYLTHFQAEQFMMGKWRRFTIGKYKVLERLGSGGMGSVYLCEHKFMRRRVAVKVLPAAKAEDPSSLERFYREARAAAALDHPNIVRAYDIDQDENLHFLVMEYVDGSSLQEIIKKTGPMNMLRAAHYVRQSAIGLQHAHESGLVHRDIKPGNLLVDRAGTLKVLDMGLARFFHDEEDILTKKYDESVLGTADYLAPEQALDSHGVDIRADIYSLGATFYFCLTGGPPFSEGTVAQKLIWHQTRAPKPIRSVRPEVPDGLVAIIDRMMTKDRSKRYQAPSQVVDALAPWTRQPIPAPPEVEMPRLSLAAMGGSQETATGAGTPTPLPSQPVQRVQPSRQGAQPVATPLRQPVPQQLRAPVAQHAQRQAPQQSRSIQPGNGAVPNWSEVTGNAPNPPAQPRTPPQKPSGIREVSGKLKPQLNKAINEIKRKPRLWLAIGGGVLLLLIVLYFLFSGSSSGGTGLLDTPTRVLTVSKDEGKGEYRTLTAALAKCEPGDHIVIKDSVHEEQVNLVSFRKVIKDVVIKADESSRVTWVPPPKSSGALISLSKCNNLIFKGVTLSGTSGGVKSPVLVSILGSCPGLTFDEVHFRDYGRAAVILVNCSGKDNQPITLRKSKFTNPVGEASALMITAGTSYPIRAIAHLRVEDCLFQGKSKQLVSCSLSGGCSMKDIDFVRNRFALADDAFFFSRWGAGRPVPSVQITFDSNTFFGMKKALALDQLPLQGSKITLRNNLFVQVREGLAYVREHKAHVSTIVLTEVGNVRDSSSKESNAPLKAAASDVRGLNLNPSSDAFLTYPANSPLNQASSNQGPVGVPPA